MGVAFPAASSKQANIIHTTLLRIIVAPPAAAAHDDGEEVEQHEHQHEQELLSEAAVAEIGDLCERLTQRYRGMQLHVGRVFWVVEDQFSTVQGQQMPIILG